MEAASHHSMFWQILAPALEQSGWQRRAGHHSTFGTFDQFKRNSRRSHWPIRSAGPG